MTNFHHRLTTVGNCPGEDIGVMTDRVLGILYLLSTQFEGDVGRISDKLVYCAIDAAIREVQDIKEVALTIK